MCVCVCGVFMFRFFESNVLFNTYCTKKNEKEMWEWGGGRENTARGGGGVKGGGEGEKYMCVVSVL